MATLFVDKIDPQSGTSLEIGSSGDTISKGSGVVSRLGVFESQLLHVRDEKASANGGSCIAGTQVRTLNTIITNEITGASLSSNRITLPAGTYYIDAQAPAFFCGRHRIFLYNYTDSSNIIIGLHTYSTANTGGDVNHSFLYGRFTLTAQKEIELQHSTQVVKASNGLGLNPTDGLTGIFANVLIWRTA